MKKTYILVIIFSVIILGITAGTYIYTSNSQNESSNGNIQNVINSVSERIEDDCTKEYEELNEGSNILETNSNEEKISPNCLITLKRHYDECGHTTKEYIDISDDLVNKTKNEIEEKYPKWEIEMFSSGEIILYKECSGECDEHYILKENEGKVIIYKINGNKKEELYETTEISLDYLTEEDKKNIKDGIKVNGKENLNQLIEDFE